jgi:hypothetical protein
MHIVESVRFNSFERLRVVHIEAFIAGLVENAATTATAVFTHIQSLMHVAPLFVGILAR